MQFSLELLNALTEISRSVKVLIDFVIGLLKPHSLHNVTVLLCDQYSTIVIWIDLRIFTSLKYNFCKYHLVLRDPCLHLLTLQLDDPPFKEMYVNSYNL